MKRNYIFGTLGGLIFFLIFSSQVSAQTLGSQRSFFVEQRFDAKARTSLSATLRHIGEKALWYVEDPYWNSLSSSVQSNFTQTLQNLSQEYDQVVYPKLTSWLGKPWEPGIDGDPRILILVTDLVQDAGGYVNTGDSQVSSVVPTSNQAELIYLNARHITHPRSKAFLAHELQHLITFSEKERRIHKLEDVWLNELRSEYAPTFLGYDDSFSGSNLESRLSAFLAKPQDSLTAWAGDSSDYGSVNLFAQYLAGRFSQALFPLTLKTQKVGIEAIQEVTSALGYTQNFPGLVLDWHLANWLNDPLIQGGVFSYRDPILSKNFPKLTTPSQSFYLSPFSKFFSSKTVEDWSGRWFKFLPSQIFESKTLLLKVSAGTVNSSPHAAVVIERKKTGPQVKFLNFVNNQALETIDDFGSQVTSVTLVYINGFQKTNFTSKPLLSQVTLEASLIESSLPTIESINPQTVFSTGGDIIIVKGKNFSADFKLTLDGIELPFTLVNSTTLRFFAPSHKPGPACLGLSKPLTGIAYERCDLLVFKPIFPDGALLRAEGDPKVWVINGPWRRHLLHPDIFGFYGHLKWEKVITVDKATLEFYKVSVLVRELNDPRVFEIGPDGKKHWLNMTPEQFTASGRSWDAIFIINQKERDFYPSGADITS